MGAKGSKATASAPRVIRISEDEVIDAADPTLFPDAVRKELMTVKNEIPPGTAFYIKEFRETSELVKWLHKAKSYFAYEGEDNAVVNLSFSLEDTGENALARRLAALRNQGGGNVNLNKDPFLYKLVKMCHGGDIREQFLANLLEVADHFVFAFLNTGHIAGFSILGEEIEGSRRCLHRYVTCVGPRKIGIGAEIVKKVHSIAKRDGYTCVTLGASASEGFHEKQGYVKTGEEASEGPEMIYRIPQEGGKRNRKSRKTRKHRK